MDTRNLLSRRTLLKASPFLAVAIPAMGAPLAALAELPVVTERSLSVLSIEGRSVLVDTANYRLDGTQAAAVMRFNGSIGIEFARNTRDMFFGGVRGGLYDVDPTSAFKEERHLSCMIIGAVIEGGV